MKGARSRSRCGVVNRVDRLDGDPDVLFHQEHRGAVGRRRAQRGEQPRDDQRREAERFLVGEHQLRPGREDA
jgi:hypothetical protein